MNWKLGYSFVRPGGAADSVHYSLLQVHQYSLSHLSSCFCHLRNFIWWKVRNIEYSHSEGAYHHLIPAQMIFKTSPSAICFWLWRQLPLDCHNVVKNNSTLHALKLQQDSFAPMPLKCQQQVRGGHVIGIYATDSSMCWYLAARPQKGHVKTKICRGGGEPNPAGAEARLSVIIQGSHLNAKRRGHQGQTCLTEWTGLGGDAAQNRCVQMCGLM